MVGIDGWAVKQPADAQAVPMQAIMRLCRLVPRIARQRPAWRRTVEYNLQ
jgi:hypothetical protein